ncbi:MAG TPA: M48 family metallopeptidase [Deltaproteobacteria bacterium]|jgi:predicted Zn-dependent protease|nr:M48 family metallopeptidase [Deltaproteobacteria bacterium]HON62299.1 M48 family metallopeptidase [Deltaproteobacteria bacterium]HQM19248.1 M48 family metallopeptidase [Deltaproteobacteria bacterium]
MKSRYLLAAYFISFMTGMFFLAGCATAPVTGRSQLLIVPEQQEIALGLEAYQQVLAQEPVSKDPQINAMVKRIGSRIAAVSDKPDYNWEFAVIDNDETANAFALPGGKVAVYTGLLPYTKNEAGLAFVIAHEIGHAIARHGGERMSQQLLLQLGQQGLNIAIANRSPEAIQAINMGYGAVSTVGVVLPFSRRQEYEADRIGLVLMAQAGYDPRESLNFFKQMMTGANKTSPPEFLSTHPADESRIRSIEEMIPEAMRYYRK